jgi:hypothetical protein
MASQLFGENYHTARQDGREPGIALAQATLQSLGEGIIEEATFSRKVGIFKTAQGMAAKKGLAKAAAEVGLGAKQLFGAGKDAYIRGFAEESAQQIQSNFWSMVFDPRPLAEDFGARVMDGALEAGAVGGILEPVMGGAFWAAGRTAGIAGTMTDAERMRRVERLAAWVQDSPSMTAADKAEVMEVLTGQKSEIRAGRYERAAGPVTARFREQVKKTVGISDRQAAVFVALADARAAAMGMTSDEWLTKYVAGVEKHDAAEAGVTQGTLFQEGDAVNPQIMDLFDRAMRDKEFKATAAFGTVETEAARRIQEATGQDVGGYSLEIGTDDVRHLMKRHGDDNEPNRGQTPITREILSKVLPLTVRSFDSVALQTAGNGQRSLVFRKRINGYAVAVEVVSDKKQRLLTKTVWIEKSRSPNAPEGPLAYVRNGSGSTETIAQNEADVKGKEPDVLYQDAERPVFVSRLREVIGQKMGGAMAAEALLSMLKNNGVKDEEIDWSGLRELTGKVTADEVAATLAENEIEIREVEKGRVPASEAESRELADLRQISEMGALTATQTQRLEALERAYTEPGKYEGYQLPGGENYRELLLTLPGGSNYNTDIENELEQRLLSAGVSQSEVDALSHEWDGMRPVIEERYGLPAQKAIQGFLKKFERVRIPHQSKHWAEPNVLAHVRYNERTDAAGKRVLFIEEIQSDWHQAGREKGYAGQVGDGGVPEAPFKKNWHELAFKRMLRFAAENGFDRLAWTPGIVQVERYSNAMRQRVDRIDLVATGDDTYAVMAAKGNTPAVRQEKQTAEQVRELIGKSVADKLMTQLAAGKAIATASGSDLTVGGEGMKGFYDHILPAFVKKYVKKWGGTLTTATLATGDTKTQTVPAVDITDAMVEGVLGGQYLFQADTSESHRRRLLKTLTAQIAAHPVYQAYAETARMAAEQIVSRLGRKLDFGKNLGDVKQYIDGISGKGYLWNYISSTPGEGQPWDTFAKETSHYTQEEISDPYVFVQMLDEAILAVRSSVGLIGSAMAQAKASGDVGFAVLARKYEMLRQGDTIEAVNAEMQKTAAELGLDPQAMAAEMLLTEMEAKREGLTAQRKAAVEFLEDGRAVIHAFESADLSSLVHEIAHVFRRTLNAGQLAAIETWAQVKDGQWTRSAEEKFARGFEKYLYDGQSPNQDLQGVFAQLRQWLRQIYERLTDSAIDIAIAPEVRQVFDTMLGGGEIHPGELNFTQFMEVFAKELMAPGSDWIQRYGLAARETPHQMHQRLRKEYKARRNEALLDTAAQTAEMELDDQLTEAQRRQVDELERAAGQTDAAVLAAERSLTISQLLEHGITDGRLVAAVRRELKAAMIAGQKKGIAAATARLKDVLAKARARKELREHIKAQARLIARPAPATADLIYREAIAALQAGVDPSFRTNKTLADRARLRALVENQEIDLPRKVREAIEKRALNEMTIAEIDALAAEITRLKKLGKLKKELRAEQRARRIKEVAAAVLDTLTGGKGIAPEAGPVVAATSKKPFLKTAAAAARAAALRPSRIMDLLDGGNGTFDGAAHTAFIDEVNRAMDAKLRQVDARLAAGEAKLAELGLTVKDLTDKRVIDGVEYQVQEMMGIYGYSLNDKSALAITFGNRISGRVLEAIRHHVETEDPRLAELVRWMIGEYDQHFGRLENAFIEVEQRRLLKEDNYLPMRRQELDYTPDARQILNELIERAHYKKAYAEKGMTIQRQDIPDEYQKPIRLDLWGLWAEQVERQEQFIHFAAVTKDLHAVVSHEAFRNAVKQEAGEDIYKALRDYVSRVANPHIYKAYGAAERISRTLRRHTAMAYLAFNLVTMGKQLPSLLYYLGDVGPGRLLASAAQFAQSPRALIEKVKALDPQVAHTALERVMEELRADHSLHQSLVRKLGEAGMAGIYWMDSVARTIGWNAVYEQALAEGKSQDEAVRLAQNATLRTQPAASAKDLAAIYTNSEAFNWFLMFSNQLSQIYNITTYDIPRAWANGQYQRAALSMAGMSLAALMMWALSNRRMPEEPKDLADAAGDQFLGMIPVFGSALLAGKRGFGGGAIVPLELAQNLSAAATRTLEGKAGRRDMEAVLEAAAIAAGVPYIGPKRVIEAIEHGDVRELVGGPPTKTKTKKGIRR